MKKVLILSYFFPPCNLTASQRAQSWANYLYDYGYKPIIITRRWDEKISHLSDVSKATINEIQHEVHDRYEVYYLPYHANFRDKIYVKYREARFNTIRKILTLFELVLQPFIIKVIPYNNIYSFALSYLKRNSDIHKMVVTGNPFTLFKFAYLLNKNTEVKWIADYRDAWTTSTINSIGKGRLHQLVNRLDSFFERKWVSSAQCITASSQPIADRVGKLVSKHGIALYNGFVPEDFLSIPEEEKFKEFTITYVGTLYKGQKIEIFCEAFKRLVNANPTVNIKLIFPGLNFYEEQRKRIDRLLKGYEQYYQSTARIERDKILGIEKKSHLLLHVAWDEHAGIIASKIYEYIASGTFILVTPTDLGAIEEIVAKSKCGVCTKNVDDTFEFLQKEYENYSAGHSRMNDVNSEDVLQFSRQKQSEKLAALLDKI